MFKCNRCPYKNNHKQLLNEHIEVVHEGVIIRCPIEGCASSFKNRSNITEHIKQLHGRETFKCQECEYEAKSQRAVRVHYGRHHGVKYFACEFCDFKAGYQHIINKHMLGAHAKELPESQQKKLNIMTCEKCGYKGTKNRMNRHLESCLKSPHRSRYKGSEFQCQTCKNANVNIFFKYKASLNRHINDKHSANPLKCEKCDYQSGYKSSLLLHKGMVHEKEKLFCNSCTYSGYNNSFLDHLRRIHNLPKMPELARNFLRCASCDEIPRTKTGYQIHTFWKHSESYAHPVYPRNKDKNPRSPIKTNQVSVTKNAMDEKAKTENVHEYVEEESISPIKLEEDIGNNDSDEISEDEQEIQIQRDKETEVKTEKFQYLCPISSCTFSTDTDSVRLLHQKSSHGILKDLPFLKMHLSSK